VHLEDCEVAPTSNAVYIARCEVNLVRSNRPAATGWYAVVEPHLTAAGRLRRSPRTPIDTDDPSEVAAARQVERRGTHCGLPPTTVENQGAGAWTNQRERDRRDAANDQSKQGAEADWSHSYIM
jgi:hypothetical protein